MARTVHEGFKAYLEKLEPSPTELTKLASHKNSIEQAIRAEFPEYNKLLVIGSHSRETAIRHYSDVDYFAKLGKADVTWGGVRVFSSTTLDRLKRTLKARFPNTDRSVDGPAVTIGFGQGVGAVDLVPGVWTGTTPTPPNYPVYDIPDVEGAWRPTAPERHSKYIKDANERSGRKLAPVVRLMKAWKYARSPKVPVFGFHLELFLVESEICVGPKSYAQMLLDVFVRLKQYRGAGLRDPIGVAGIIPAVRTDAQRTAFVNHLDFAIDNAARAITAEHQADINGAFYYWNRVFNGQFPAR